VFCRICKEKKDVMVANGRKQQKKCRAKTVRTLQSVADRAIRVDIKDNRMEKTFLGEQGKKRNQGREQTSFVARGAGDQKLASD